MESRDQQATSDSQSLIPDPPLPDPLLEKAGVLRRDVADLFITTETALNKPRPEYIRFRGRLLRDSADCYDTLRGRFEKHGFTPMLRRHKGATYLIATPVVYEPVRSKWIVNLILFIATIFSTLYVGALYNETNPEYLFSLSWLLTGWPFSLSLLLILGAHELGHYFAARYHGVPVTLPYFIPLPTQYSLIGTMGAFIQLKAPVKDRRALLDVGASGPLAGMVFALPILAYGLATSPVGQLPATGYLSEGNSLLYLLMKFLIHGQLLPSNGMDVSLNQVAWAGWVGLLVTGLNLLPLGQLDGGHVSYTLFGEEARKFFWPVIGVLGAIILLTQTYTWAVWIMMLFFVGRRHAEPLDDITPLDEKRLWVARGILVLFFLVFVPIPFRVVMP